jgi:tripartite ATP-independent transporter DctM subunit
MTLLMVVLLGLGIPVAISMGMAGLVGLILIGGPDFLYGQLQTMPYSITANYDFAVMPTFLLMGNLAMNSGMAAELYIAADRWLGHFRGGLYLATIAGATAFAAISGSPLVNATVFTRVALPEMLKLGYSKSVASACIASVGTLAAMIPPSIGMVVYGILTETSIGKLMIAGIVPGLITAGLYCITIMVWVRRDPSIAPKLRGRSSAPERWKALGNTWSIILLFMCLMAGLYGGLFSPSAAGAMGAFFALIIVIARRRMTWPMLMESLRSSAQTTAMLFIIIIGGLLYSRMLVMSGYVGQVVDYVGGLGLSPTVLLLLVSVLYIILGCFMDGVSMLLVTMPFVFPIIKNAGIDPVFFGILVIAFIEIGAITPPIGLNLFATAGAGAGMIKMGDILRGIVPFVILNVIALLIFIFFPDIVLWLPSHMEF